MKRIITVIITLSLFILSSCMQHTHTFSDATCQQRQKCSTCGEYRGSYEKHNYAEATCTEPKRCINCNVSVYEPLGHVIESGVVEKQPTCSETGVENGTCTRCGETITQEIATLEHTSTDWIVEVAPTFDSAGIERKRCTVCGKELASRERPLTDEERKPLYIEKCETFTYKDISRNPYQYEGKYAKYTGKVMQVIRESDSEYRDVVYCYYLVQVTKEGYFWDDIMYVTYERGKYDARILEDDVITFYGALSKPYNYQTTGGSSNTVPRLDAEYYTLH